VTTPITFIATEQTDAGTLYTAYADNAPVGFCVAPTFEDAKRVIQSVAFLEQFPGGVTLIDPPLSAMDMERG
jgi:hypothetical protein